MKVNVGTIIATRGLKGELKIASDFDLTGVKNVFIHDLELKVKSLKFYKNFQYLVFENYEDINKVEKFKKGAVFVLKEDLNFEEDTFLVSELIDFEVYQNGLIGTVVDVFNNNAHDIIRVKTKDKDVLIPFLNVFVKNIDEINKKITVELLEDAN